MSIPAAGAAAAPPHPLVARVALPIPVEEPFDYAVPPELGPRVRPGMRVRVPLGRRRVVGFVVATGPAPPGGRPLKPIEAVVDEEPPVDAELLDLARWAAEYYLSSWGEMLACAVPAARPRPRPAVIRLTAAGRAAAGGLEAAVGRSRRRAELVERLRSGPLRRTELPRDAARLLGPLLEAGLVEWVDEEPPDLPAPAPIVPNPDQEAALGRLRDRLEAGRFAPLLLRGVTASGKTEVYLRAAEEALARGRGVLYLVPEIGLTPLLAQRFVGRFGDRVALLHSGLPPGERAEAWRRARRGEASVILGVRSAVFAPLQRPGLIIVDEEQDSSFKQEERPRYHARDLALVRGRRSGAVVVLGSATPSLESYQRARQGSYELLELTARVEGRPMATAEVVDMRREPEAAAGSGLSARLLELLRDRLQRGEQSVLLLNRRGYATFVLCRECGQLVQCPLCSVSLVYHRADRALRCHYCGHRRGYPERCPSCSGTRLHAGGEGTERLEERLAQVLPGARLCRLDRDTVRRRGNAQRLLEGFVRGEGDLLLGTQMVAKGHDFPRVTLVGVLAAEATLGLPDFRAAERTFQLLTQVAGRSGRGEAPGRVVIQTFQPGHYAIRHAQAQDFPAFFEEELRFRRRLQYPPFTVLANLLVARSDAAAARRQAEALARALQRAGGGHLRILGPAPAPLARLRGRYRVQILVKARARGRLGAAIRAALDEQAAGGAAVRHVSVDRDPMSLL